MKMISLVIIMIIEGNGCLEQSFLSLSLSLIMISQDWWTLHANERVHLPLPPPPPSSCYSQMMMMLLLLPKFTLTTCATWCSWKMKKMRENKRSRHEERWDVCVASMQKRQHNYPCKWMQEIRSLLPLQEFFPSSSPSGCHRRHSQAMRNCSEDIEWAEKTF